MIFSQEGRRKDSRFGEELRHLGPIRLAIWNSQHVPWIPRHQDRRRRHPVLPRHGRSPSSSTWIHPDPSSKFTILHFLIFLCSIFLDFLVKKRRSEISTRKLMTSFIFDSKVIFSLNFCKLKEQSGKAIALLVWKKLLRNYFWVENKLRHHFLRWSLALFASLFFYIKRVKN